MAFPFNSFLVRQLARLVFPTCLAPSNKTRTRFHFFEGSFMNKSEYLRGGGIIPLLSFRCFKTFSRGFCTGSFESGVFSQTIFNFLSDVKDSGRYPKFWLYDISKCVNSLSCVKSLGSDARLFLDRSRDLQSIKTILVQTRTPDKVSESNRSSSLRLLK